jgi:hypothetical protein
MMRAPADGYTLMLVAAPHAINADAAAKQCRQRAARRGVPVAGLYTGTFVMIVSAVAADQDAVRVHRLRQGQSRQDQLHIDRRRQPEPPVRRNVQER